MVKKKKTKRKPSKEFTYVRWLLEYGRDGKKELIKYTLSSEQIWLNNSDIMNERIYSWLRILDVVKLTFTLSIPFRCHVNGVLFSIVYNQAWILHAHEHYMLHYVKWQ